MRRASAVGRNCVRRCLRMAAAPGLAVLLAGCFTATYQRGYIFDEASLDQVPPGSSQEQVLLVLGTPSTVATVSGEMFYYISQKAQRTAFLNPEITDQRVLAVYFDQRPPRRAHRQLRHEGRQSVRLHQPHDGDRRAGDQNLIRQISQGSHLHAEAAAIKHRPDFAGRCVTFRRAQCARIASSNSATMLVILIIGFTAGPAVSL